VFLPNITSIERLASRVGSGTYSPASPEPEGERERI
jgi:hypothetical protein